MEVRVDKEFLHEQMGGKVVAVAQYAQHKMFRPYIVVVQTYCLLLGVGENLIEIVKLLKRNFINW